MKFHHRAVVLSICTLMILKLSKATTLPEIVDKIIGFGDIINAHKWLTVSHRCRDTSSKVLHEMLFRHGPENELQPDLFKIIRVYGNLSDNEKGFLRRMLLKWNLMAFNSRKKVHLKIADNEIKVVQKFSFSNSTQFFLYLYQKDLLTTIPFLLKDQSSDFIQNIISLVASFPFFDDISNGIFQENPELVSVKICNIYAAIRGSSKILKSCVSLLKEEDQWKFPDVQAKDVDLSLAGSIFAEMFHKDEIYPIYFIELMKSVFKHYGDKSISASMFDISLKYFEQDKFRKFDIDSLEYIKQLMIITRNYTPYFQVLTEKLAPIFQTFVLAPCLFPFLVKIFESTIDEKQIQPVIRSLMLAFKDELNVENIIFYFLERDDWNNNFFLVSKFLALGPKHLLGTFLLALAKYTIFDGIIMNALEENLDLVSADTLQELELVKIRRLECVKYEKMLEWLCEYYQIYHAYFLRILIVHLLKNNADEELIFQYVQNQFLCADDDFGYGATLSDALWIYVSESIPLKTRQLAWICIENKMQNIEKTDSKSKERMGMISCIVLLLEETRWSRRAVETLADVFWHVANFELVLEYTSYSPRREYINLALGLRKFDVVQLKPLIDRIFSTFEPIQFLDVLSLMGTPLNKTESLTGRIDQSHTAFYSTIKLFDFDSDSYDLKSVFVLLEHPEFAKNFLIVRSKREGLQFLAKVLSACRLSESLTEKAISALASFQEHYTGGDPGKPFGIWSIFKNPDF